MREIERLDDVVERALVDRLESGRDRHMPGHDNDGTRRVECSRRAEEGKSIDMGHPQIGDERIEGPICKELDGFASKSKGHGSVSAIAKLIGHHCGHLEIVVDDEDAKRSLMRHDEARLGPRGARCTPLYREVAAAQW